MGSRFRFVPFLLVGVVGWSGCSKRTPAATAGGPPAPGASMAVQVVAVEAKRKPVVETLSLVGTLIANEQIEVKSEIDGTVASLNFQEGQRVNKGDLLVQLDASKLQAAAAEAEANYKLTQTTYERNQQLLRDKLVSQQEYDISLSQFLVTEATLARRKSELADTRIFAPFSGIIGSRNVSPGQVISKNTTITWLVDLDLLKAEFNVPERFLRQIRPGLTLQMAVAAYPGEFFKGEVYFVAPQVEPATRTVLVRAYVKNPEARLKPGMFANLDLGLQVRENAIVIPEPAIIPSGDRTMVLIVDTEDAAQIRPVKVGLRLSGEAEILSGLKDGERVIVEGVQKARPGAKVRLAPPEAAAPYAQKPAGTSSE